MARAGRLLERMRRSKFGWTPEDVERVYAAHGFECRHGAKHDLFQHRQHRRLIATVKRTNPLKPAYIDDLLKLIDELERLEGSTQ